MNNKEERIIERNLDAKINYTKGYLEGIEKGKLLAREEELKFLCDNRDIIEGVDVIAVDKRIKELKRKC